MIDVKYMFLLSRQGKVRLIKWYDVFTHKEKQRILKDISTLVLSRKAKMCNIIEYNNTTEATTTTTSTVATSTNTAIAATTGTNNSGSSGHKVIYKRYASLFFICGIDENSNELLTLEMIHRYVETLDKYFGNVCELDIIFNFSKAYYVLNEMFGCTGALMESSKKDILHNISLMDSIESSDNLSSVLS
ncbi:related to AP-1 complex subunit sigma-1 [Saccharomycodes ludwigii]|uniref:AP complex subunit sigma n=1 Tax=Saccharomycodes ludwigii TaxID=36035 RepID=A0A376BA24_9ASCO|nr:hypothetical protein SCDLUD_003464 [Saccharomycodes ludwigii]KAH3900479.1 hypothetical protein SCDLUD_003464 [Saccharomycodes ludwigii]SSD61451.1 related to AP-1 complex subunit sigma-1 [Saccharomycodes ludwigii]